jgi:hypothetical protein
MNAVAHSRFVSVVGWVFIVVSALGTITAMIQNIVVHALGPQVGILSHASPPPNASWFTVLVMSHLNFYFAVLFAIFVITFVSSIGLVKRRNWARLAFVGLMALGVLWNIPALFSPFATHKLYIFYSLVLIFLFGWIGTRLASSKTTAEFAGER